MSRSAVLAAVTTLVLFAAVAVWTGSKIARSCMDAMLLRDAAVVNATILDIERRTESYRDRSREIVFVTYSYSYEGQPYKARTDRLIVFGSSTPSMHGQLENAMRSSSPVVCHVARAKPSLSVFSLEFSIPLFLISMLFPLGFGSVSVFITRYLFREWRQHSKAGSTA